MDNMQSMKKVLPIFLSLIVIVAIALILTTGKKENDVPQISNPKGEFVKIDSSTFIENNEYYFTLLDKYGTSQLENDLLTDLLTNASTNYIDLAKNDEDFNIDEEIEKMKYESLTLAEAQKIHTAEEMAEFETDFEKNLKNSGFHNLAEYEEIFYLNHAKELYTRNFIYSELVTSEDSPIIELSDIAKFYEDTKYETANLIKIRFDNIKDATVLLESQNIEIDSSGDFVNEVNAADILTAYSNIYNNKYSYLNDTPLQEYSYDDLKEESAQLAKYVFSSLAAENDESEIASDLKPYSDLISFDGNQTYYLIYKSDGDKINDFKTFYSSLTDEEYNDILTTSPLSPNSANDTEVHRLLIDYIKSISSNSTEINDAMLDLKEKSELTIYDSYLKFSYDKFGYETADNEGSSNIVYSYKLNDVTKEINADTFFNRLNYRYAVPYSKNLIFRDLSFNEIYSDGTPSEVEDELTSQITSYKLNFQSGQYASFGFTPTNSTWKQFMVSNFKVRSESELYNSLLKSRAIEEHLEELTTTPELETVYYSKMVENYEKAFTIDLFHFLVYIDSDQDSKPDKSLNNVDWSDNQKNLASELLNLLRTKLNTISTTEEITFTALDAIYSDYLEASYITDKNDPDYSEYAKYKLAGLLLKTEDLSTVTEGQMADAFEEESKTMYDKMIAEDFNKLISPNNVETEFGFHLIYSHGTSNKLDAYKDDSNLTYPTRDDIDIFVSGDTDEELSTPITLFIETYYVPAKTEYITENQDDIIAEFIDNSNPVSFTNLSMEEEFYQFLKI